MIRLRRLVVHRFRSVKPGCAFEFSDRFNIVLGKNGTGKTTLLKLITILFSSDFSALEDEEVDVEYELEVIDWMLGLRVRHTIAQTDQGEESRWEGTASVANSSGEVSVISRNMTDWITPKGQRIAPGKSIPLGLAAAIALHHATGEAKGIRISQHPGIVLASEQSIRRFDEALSAYDALIRDEPLLMVDFHQSMQPLVRSTSEGSIQTFFTPQFVRSTSDQLVIAAKSPAGRSLVELDAASYAFVNRTNELLDGPRLAWYLQWASRSAAQGGPVTDAYTGLSFTVRLTNGTELNSAESLSFGQKRLIAFMYYLACNPNVVIADELVNGMHHSWLEALMPEIEKRQSFLALQNPLLLDYLWFESAHELRRSFVLCRQSEDSRAWVWEHMDVEQANAIFEAYRQGFQHVSTILKSYGVW